jgi:hypothetical protein
MRNRARQGGAALMAMLVVVIIGGAWWLVSGLKAAGNRTVVDRSHNAKVLAEAKAALIAWAANNAADPTENYPGRLPCPEGAAWIGNANAEGIAAPGLQPPLPETQISVPNCSSVGRLPWRTLGLPKLIDASGEPLWYIVTTGSTGWALANATTALSINSNKADTITVNGNPNAAVAAIIAPGAPMRVGPNANQIAVGCAAQTQSRTASTPNVANYLECQSTSSSPIGVRTQVVDNATNPTFNDQIVLITAAEVLAAIEPMVAQRIQTQVLPQLQSASALYASSEWGTSAANPMFPFAVTFGDPGASPTSTFKGTAGKTEGLLPLNALTCSAITTGRCDPNFHAFNLASISVAATANGPFTSSDCTATSSTAQIRCTMSFTRVCLIICSMPTIRVEGYASNIALAMRTFNTAAATTPGLVSSTVTVTAPLQPDGSARVTVTGIMSASGSILCGFLISVACSGSATVTVPISAFQDHPFINPTTANNWYWFFANNWHHVTYYAVAPLHTPGGAGSCSGTTCLSVTKYGDTSLSGTRAVLVLGGRSLTGTGGITNRSLADFLDGTENTNSDLKFEQYKSNRTFNDRFVAISP